VFTGGLTSWVAQWNKDNPNIAGFGGKEKSTLQGVELDLRPGKAIPRRHREWPAAMAGTPGGEYPFGVVVAGGVRVACRLDSLCIEPGATARSTVVKMEPIVLTVRHPVLQRDRPAT